MCARPLGAADYLEIAERFHTVLLENIPRLSPSKREEAARFRTLIDALYEAKVKLVASADAQPADALSRRRSELRIRTHRLAADGNAQRSLSRAAAPRRGVEERDRRLDRLAAVFRSAAENKSGADGVRRRRMVMRNIGREPSMRRGSRDEPGIRKWQRRAALHSAVALVVSNAGLTPRLPDGAFAQLSASQICLVRQSLAALAAILMTFGSVGIVSA